jgi:Ca2+-transporting ATPase
MPQVTYQGLSTSQAKHNNEKYGLNQLTPPPKPNLLKIYLEKYNDPIVRILLVAALVSVGIGLYEGSIIEGVGIIIAVLLATTMAFVNEYQAGKEFALLNKNNDIIHYKTLRDGETISVLKSHLTVDDIVFLETGEAVPADGLVFEASSFEVDESTLTGESVPVLKRAYNEGETSESNYPVYKVFNGTLVKNGRAVIKIEGVGDATELGRTAKLAGEERKVKTPLTLQLEKLAQFIGRVGFSMAGFLVIILVVRAFADGNLSTANALANNLHTLLEIFLLAVALIVMSVPEGLPMSITLSLAYSVRKMLADNTLVRHMSASETIGATTVICSDKTGTLTANKMSVVSGYFVNNGLEDELIRLALAVNSSAHLEGNDDEVKVLGNPTEGALLLYLHSNKVNYRLYRQQFKVINECPFNTENKYMSTVGHDANLGEIMLIKGAPEVLLKACTKFGNKSSEEWQTLVASEQAKARRTLGFAVQYGANGDSCSLKLDGLPNIEWLGFVAIADPLRPEAFEAVANCHKAGINVKMLTGDSIETASQIGRELGLLTSDKGNEAAVLTGPQFAALNDEEATVMAKKLVIMARSRPQDKLRLAQLLQKEGEVVAMTGDGTNDAPALSQANVGLAMGQTGTAVSKEASDIILMDDSFKSIVNAVMWGRSLYANIQRFLVFQLTVNVSAVITALVGPFIGINAPLTVMQILWVNLIMDTFAALALATENADPSVLSHKPRDKGAFIITKRMARFILGVGLSFVVIFCSFLFYYRNNLSRENETIFFTLFVLAQFWNLFNARFFARKISLKDFFSNKSFWIISLFILIGQFVLVNMGQQVFRTTAMSLSEYIKLVLVTSPIFIILLIGKKIGQLFTKKR